MYGTQTHSGAGEMEGEFENDVKMYGTQTPHIRFPQCDLFENDVKMYGTQTSAWFEKRQTRLRMM